MIHLKPGDRVVVPFNVSCGGSCCENSNPSSDVAGGVVIRRLRAW
ncbi:hypothetical protein [Myxococcus xanthus]